MAMEEIIVRLGVDSSGFVRGVDQVNGKLDEAGGWVDKIGAKLASLITVAALTNLAKEAVQYASNMQDAAEATRTGTEEYQVLAAMARESGASIQQLDQALIKSTLSGEKAAEGSKELQSAFAALNIEVDKFNALPTERKLEALGAAYIAAGRSQEAYTAITDILGTKSAPRLISMLESLGRDGVDPATAKFREMGVILDDLSTKKLDELADKAASWKVKTLVFLDEAIAGWLHLWEVIKSGRSSVEVVMDQEDPARALARVEATNQLIEEALAAHQARMDELGSRRNPYYNETLAREKLINEVRADGEAIETRMLSILAEKRQREAEIVAKNHEENAAKAQTAAWQESSLATTNALKMVEEGRALIRLKEMTDKERLVALEEAHRQALVELSVIEHYGEGTAKEKEAIAKRVLDIEKQISDTKAKIDADTLKAAEERAKKQEDLLELLREQVEIEAAITADYVNRYSRTPSEIIASGGGSSLTANASEMERLLADAQRNFDSAARLRSDAEGLTGAQLESALRAAAEAEARAREADTRRGQLQTEFDAAQGIATGDPLVDKMEENRKEIEKLREELESA